VFDKLSKYHIKMLLRDLNVEVGREDIFKQTIGNEVEHRPRVFVNRVLRRIFRPKMDEVMGR
jgi:hypothetical protein